eukprot:TRINITY_DN16707_c0_g1_i1.p2 TRINITY_DN16707_c0_g1~~TRINITY_DN16707_c0_g1_i1.p2  ORF type:complete len:121 (+),score=24.61 TRINITY_DN16707_c0_g1_i1:797-1159(+)
MAVDGLHAAWQRSCPQQRGRRCGALQRGAAATPAARLRARACPRGWRVYTGAALLIALAAQVCSAAGASNCRLDVRRRWSAGVACNRALIALSVVTQRFGAELEQRCAAVACVLCDAVCR